MMMRPITEDGIRKFTLGDGFTFAVDILPPETRRKWDLLCADIERGADVRSALKNLTAETLKALQPTVAMRLAHAALRRSILDIGLDEDAASAARD
jgi:hypothetical protein